MSHPLDSLTLKEPAFILGNAPRLPVDSLHLLDGFFTIGVNQIVKVYDPTVLLIADKSAYDLARPLFGKSQKLFSPKMDVKDKAWRPTLFTASLKWSQDPSELHLDGNSGVGAASWATSLGCEPVYLLGMEAKNAPGKTDFYGVNPRHRQGTIEALGVALNRLVNSHPHVVQVANGAHLAKLIKRHTPHDREYFMEQLNG